MRAGLRGGNVRAMQKLVLSALLMAIVACSSKPKEAPTTASVVQAGATEQTPAQDMGSAAAGSAMDHAGSAAVAAGSAMDHAGSAAAATGSTMNHAAADAGHAASTAAKPPAFDFDKLTHEEKMDFMKKTVVPTMKPLFQDFDKKKYANFGCKTCHGKDPVKTKYKMPNDSLTKLDFAKLKEGKQAPKVAEWMGKVVKPEMAKLLQMSEYTESNPTGFGCLHCHTQKQ